MKYKRKPIIVEAFQFNVGSDMIVPKWFIKELQKETIFIDRCSRDGTVHVYGCTITSTYGKLKVKLGDFIVKESSGEIRPYKMKNFKEQYERM